jgi:hypothetical protein
MAIPSQTINLNRIGLLKLLRTSLFEVVTEVEVEEEIGAAAFSPLILLNSDLISEITTGVLPPFFSSVVTDFRDFEWRQVSIILPNSPTPNMARPPYSACVLRVVAGTVS